MANKIYTTLRQQLKILRSKNMNISINGQGAKVKKILERENYYSVINGYKDPFIQTSSNNETFISNTQFENLYTLFTFDRNVPVSYTHLDVYKRQIESLWLVEKDLASFANTAMSRTLKKSRRLR